MNEFSSCTKILSSDIGGTTPVTLLTWFSVTIRKGLIITSSPHNSPIAVLLQLSAQIVRVQAAVLVHTDLHVITIGLSPRQQVAVVLVGTHKHDGSRGVVRNGLHSTTRRFGHIGLPGARVTVRVRALVETKIAGLAEAQRTAGEGTVPRLHS